MPRIDPLQLLNCLGVLLRPDGGIRSESEVLRLASLMTKFSKKLVSKCIYVQILKRSETRLLELFMASGGWSLIHAWLSDGIINKNWALVQELLELLLLSPVDVEILKTNNCPKLVKGLSKDENQEGVRLLAGKLVEQWLRLVKGEPVKPIDEPSEDQNVPSENLELSNLTNNYIDQQDNDINLPQNNSVPTTPPVENKISVEETPIVEKNDCSDKIEDTVNNTSQTQDLKLTTQNNDEMVSNISIDKDSVLGKNKEKKEKHHASDKSQKSSNKSPSSKHSSSKSSSNSHRKSKDKDRDRKSSSKSSTKDRDRDKDKDKERERERERSKQEEKDKATLDKLKPKTLSKLGKIPKKTSNSSDEKISKQDDKSVKDDKAHKSDEKGNKIESKKPSISIEIRKNEGSRPKTVKTFNSKFRSHGLEEEAKPAPPRPVKKSSSNLAASVPLVKRPSPPPRYDNIIPPEKKAKIIETTVSTKPGAIKLIPAKPKPSLLMESDMFMDALSASASNKKEPRKRKRKLSTSKDSESETQASAKSSSPPHSPKAEVPIEAKSSIQTDIQIDSSNEVISAAPPRFYQDTLENTDEEQETETEKEPEQSVTTSSQEDSASPTCETEKDNKTEDTDDTETLIQDSTPLKGVLLYSKRKGPKKKLQWRTEDELVDIQYFELDETERVNVTKTFTDMKQMERVNEREAFQLARKLPNEDTMEERTSWMILIPVDDVAVINFGKNSREKDIQYARERTVAPTMYYHRMMIPDSPAEPDPELFSVTDPTIIPLDDVTGNPDTVNDFQNTPWPEPKGIAPPPTVTTLVTPFSTVPPMMPFAHGPGMPFTIPPFAGHPGHPGPPPFPMRGPNIESMPPMSPDMMMNGGMFPPRMDGPVDGNMMQMNGFGPPFGAHFTSHNPSSGFPGTRGLRPPIGNMGGARGPPPNSGWYRAPGSGGPVGPGGPGPAWQNGPRKNWNPRICRQFYRKGFCNKGDNCLYLHPGINCPPL